MMRHSQRAFVEQLDFLTTIGFGDGPGFRDRLGLRGAGPTAVVTDLGVLRPDPASCELLLTQAHPGATVDDVKAATGWPLRVSSQVEITDPPTQFELEQLDRLEAQAAT